MKLNQKGFAHWIVPALVIVAIGGIGTVFLTLSHADSLTPQSICGSGYQAYMTNPVIGSALNSRPDIGKVHILANPNKKQICIVTMSGDATYGTSKSMKAELQLDGAGTKAQTDSGSYKYYAGPEYIAYPKKNQGFAFTGQIKWNGNTFLWFGDDEGDTGNKSDPQLP